MRFSRLALQVLAVLSVVANNSLVWADEDVESADAGGLEAPADAESFKFEAEVHRMLDIVVNSLYQNKDVFLRELISNGSDALDKFRYLSLTEPESYPTTDAEGNEIPMELKLDFDEENRLITIRDTGIGMTHDDMVENLGTVARSGTTKFLEALQEKGDDQINQIGQFGVGFYSSFLVADRVTVASKHPSSDVQYVWESLNGQSDFKVYPDPRGNTLGRGTEIKLYLKEDCLEYAQEDRMSDLAKHYSEFVTYPIYMKTLVTEEVPVEDDGAGTGESADGDDLDIGEEQDALDDDGPETTTITVESWEELNKNPAIWTRDKDTVTNEEYQGFWNSLSPGENNATAWSHFNAEGNINFKSILYLPDEIPGDFKVGTASITPGRMRLYVRKVLISDEFELMPRYLGFIRGVVDSDDLPLNVNRETLQETKIISVIRKKLVRKTIEMIKSLMKDEKKEDDEEEVEIDADGNVIEKEKKKPIKEARYIEWYEKFAPSIKLGVMEDEPNRGKLTKLLRFKSSKSGDNWVSLDDYVKNKKDWQDEIYVLAGLDVKTIEKSPFLDPFREKDVEVLYLFDPIDEYLFQWVKDYDDNKVVHISSSGVKLKDEDQDLVKRREKAYKKQFQPLTKWLKKLYGNSIMRVSISKRLGSSPAIVSSGEFGHSANMERIMRAQALQHGQDQYSMKAVKVFEINPRHPLVLKLLEGAPVDDDAPVADDIKEAAWILYDMAMLNGGFPLENPASHSERMLNILKSQLDVDTFDLEPEIDPPVDEDEAPEIEVEKLGYGNVGPDGGINIMDYDGDIPDIDISAM